VLPSVSSVFEILDTWEHRRGHISKTVLTDGSTAVSSAILETREDDQWWSKRILWCDVGEISAFKTSTCYKKQVAYETAENYHNKYVMCNSIL
jgi:hypothetical protein